jgi:hypothetical protein
MPDLTGVTFGPYRILNLIGRGGMSTVYRAYQPRMDRLVALKVLLDHISAEEKVVRRFEQEARLIARLEHRNIVPLYDSGEQDGTLYLAMRYVRAGVISDLLARGPLTLRDAAGLIAGVAAALDHAHSQGIVHRDVKPNNVLVDSEGHAYLTDFGLAKLLGEAARLTGTSVTLGTPTYMAPEQALNHTITPQTDVYALGVMLYEMIVGAPPFSADTPMALAMMHVREPLRPPRQVNPYVSEAAEAVIARALQKDPAARYASAGEMARALTEAASTDEQARRDYIARNILVPRDAGSGAEVTALQTLADEIAQAKEDDQVTQQLRDELSRQDRSAGRRRWLGAGRVALGGLAVAVLAFAGVLWLDPSARVRQEAEATATAVALLLGDLNAAQTAAAQGEAGLEPTLAFLQTQLAAGQAGVNPTLAAGTPTPNGTASDGGILPGQTTGPLLTSTRPPTNRARRPTHRPPSRPAPRTPPIPRRPQTLLRRPQRIHPRSRSRRISFRRCWMDCCRS